MSAVEGRREGMTTYLFLNLLFFVHLFGHFDCFSKLLCRFVLYIQSELKENDEKRVWWPMTLQCRCTSSRMADRHLMRALKSPFPRTLRSSQFARTSGVVKSRRHHLRYTSVMQALYDTRNETYSFSSSVLSEILLTLPRKVTGSSPRINSAAVPSLNSV
jgi:hypothetical protein